MTLRQFLLKKFSKHKYTDCPVPKHHWETIQEFADEQTIGFAEFLRTKCNLSSSTNEWLYQSTYYSEKEILRIYKEKL